LISKATIIKIIATTIGPANIANIVSILQLRERQTMPTKAALLCGPGNHLPVADFVSDSMAAPQFASQPANRVWPERVASRNLFFGVTALQALKRTVFETFGAGTDIRHQHSHLAFRASRATDR
jgi:hypothetical protein